MEMSDIHRQVLQQNHVDLLKNLKLDSDILGILYEKGTLTEHMVQVIQVGKNAFKFNFTEQWNLAISTSVFLHTR